MFSIKSKYSKALLRLKYVEYMYRFFTLNFFHLLLSDFLLLYFNQFSYSIIAIIWRLLIRFPDFYLCFNGPFYNYDSSIATYSAPLFSPILLSKSGFWFDQI